jgi:hypothetical protein
MRWSMKIRSKTTTAAVVLAVCAGALVAAQSASPPEDFRATAIANNNLASGIGRVDIRISRWSSDAERTKFATLLLKEGPDALLDALQDASRVGFVRTPDSLAYDLRYAHQVKDEEGGRRIVIATDRPIGFWEASNMPRTIDYPFTVIQMHLGPDGKGQGTLSYATKITANNNLIILEDFATSPVMLKEIESEPRK